MTQNPAAIMQPSERFSFLGNLGALLDAGIVHGDQYLAVLGRFADEPDPRVIAALAGACRRRKNPS